MHCSHNYDTDKIEIIIENQDVHRIRVISTFNDNAEDTIFGDDINGMRSKITSQSSNDNKNRSGKEMEDPLHCLVLKAVH